MANALISQIKAPNNVVYDIKDAAARESIESLDGRYLQLTGGTVTGTLILSRTTDAAGTANNKPALIVGGTDTQKHIEIDNDEIHAKANGTSVSPLYLNWDGGNVVTGVGGVRTLGTVRVAASASNANTGGCELEYVSATNSLNFNFN